MGGNLKIGATVDVAEIKAGMQATVEEVKAAAAKMPIAFEEAAGRTKAAFNRISDETKQAAQVVSIASAKVAAATKEYAAAMNELRNATIVAKDAKLDDTETTNLLAAAQQKAAATARDLAEAKQAEARSVAAAAEEEALSQNVVVRAFQRAARSAVESSELIREQMIETAETGGLSAEGISAGFAGLSSLLGAGIAIGFIAHYGDELQKLQVELDHLSAKTGISITYLAGLQQILKETGGDFETVATGLVRMESNTEKLANHDKALGEAFSNLGLKLNDVWKAKPEELLQMIATGMANTADANIRANSAIAIFGRGGQALIPVLREYSDQLNAVAIATGKLTGINDESAQAARRWTQDTARLSSEFRSVMIPIMEHAEDVIQGIIGVAAIGRAVMFTFFDVARAAAISAYKPIKNIAVALYDEVLPAFEAVRSFAIAALTPVIRTAEALYDLAHGKMSQAIQDAKSNAPVFSDTWNKAFDDIKAHWKTAKDAFTESSPLPPLPKPGDDADRGDIPDKPKKGHVKTAFQKDEEELNELRFETAKRGYAVGLNGELDFWTKKLAIAKQGTDEYKSIVGKLASLEEERLKAGKKKQEFAEVTHDNISASDVDKITSEMSKEVKEEQKQQVEAQREAIDEQIRLAAEGYKEAEQDSQFQVQLGRSTARQRIQTLQDAAKQEYAIEMGLIQAKELLDSGDVAKYQQDKNKEVEITRRYGLLVKHLHQELTLEVGKFWKDEFKKIQTGFNDAVSQMVVTGKGFKQAMAQVFASLVQDITRRILEMTEQWLIGLALQKDGQKKSIFADAKTAAAHTYASVSGIPVVGPFLAPVAAAGAFAAVMAFDSFHQGGVVGGPSGAEVPILAKQGERVLSPSQTQNFETLVNTRHNSSSSSRTVNVGEINNHLHGTKATAREAAKHTENALRRGMLGYA